MSGMFQRPILANRPLQPADKPRRAAGTGSKKRVYPTVAVGDNIELLVKDPSEALGRLLTHLWTQINVTYEWSRDHAIAFIYLENTLTYENPIRLTGASPKSVSKVR